MILSIRPVPFVNIPQELPSRVARTAMKKHPQVIVYRYDGSPFAAKLDNILAYKGIHHMKVTVPMTLPRQDITDRLGIGYRRIPVLAIGNDVYCDTSLIIPALERSFPEEKGYPTLFPQRKDSTRADTGMMKAFATFYTDRVLFPLAASLLPYQKFPASFIADRIAWQGSKMDVDDIVARQPSIKSTLISHLSLLEEHLSDGREWLFDTKSPSHADFSVHFVYSWIIHFRNMRDVLNADNFPLSVAWLTHLTELLNHKKGLLGPNVSEIAGEAAAKAIGAAQEHHVEVTFDTAEAERLGVKQGSLVAVAPDDNARDYPTFGKLIGLNREEFVLQLSGGDVPSLRCHFPRLNFVIANRRDCKL